MVQANNRMTRADLITGLVFVAIGVATFYLAWTMPRLENRGVHPLAIPGLVPMILGACLTLCGVLLAGRSLRLGALGPLPELESYRNLFMSKESVRLGLMLLLTLVYSLILVGWLPFWLATGLYLFSSIVLFEHFIADPEDRKPLVRSSIWALVQAVIATVVLVLVFQEGFLIRLP